MILTNALLKAGLVIISNFASNVPIPQEALPTDIADLRRFTAGDPLSPANMYLVLRNGATFGIRFGVVTIYDAPNNYIHIQDSAQLPMLLGAPALSSNQVLELASCAVQRLVKGTNPIARVQPLMRTAGKTPEGAELPFYEVMWPKPGDGPGFGYFAAVEVDARVGRITSLHVADPGFHDYALAQELRRRTYVPQGPDWWTQSTNPGTTTTYSMRFPSATTNEVAQGIISWLWLCRRLGIDTGPDGSVHTVNWANTCILTNMHRTSETDRVCRVEFRSGASFLSVSGVAFAHTAADSYTTYRWPPWTSEQMLTFRGTVRHREKDLASELERRLIEDFGVPKQYFEPYLVRNNTAEPPLGTQVDHKRALVLWEHRPDWNYQGLAVEFDLETGRLVDIGFSDPKLIDAIARAQGRHLD